MSERLLGLDGTWHEHVEDGECDTLRGPGFYPRCSCGWKGSAAGVDLRWGQWMTHAEDHQCWYGGVPGATR